MRYEQRWGGGGVLGYEGPQLYNNSDPFFKLLVDLEGKRGKEKWNENEEEKRGNGGGEE